MSADNILRVNQELLPQAFFGDAPSRLPMAVMPLAEARRIAVRERLNNQRLENRLNQLQLASRDLTVMHDKIENIQNLFNNMVKETTLLLQTVQHTKEILHDLSHLKRKKENLLKKQMHYLAALQTNGSSLGENLTIEKFLQLEKEYKNKQLEFEQAIQLGVNAAQRILHAVGPEPDSNNDQLDTHFVSHAITQPKNNASQRLQNKKRKKKQKLQQKKSAVFQSPLFPQQLIPPNLAPQAPASKIIAIKNRIELSKKFNQSPRPGNTILDIRQEIWGQGDYEAIRQSYDFDFTKNEYVQHYLLCSDPEIQYFIDIKDIPMEKIISILSLYVFDMDIFTISAIDINKDAIEFANSLRNPADGNVPQLTLLDRYHVRYTYLSVSGKLHKGRAFLATQVINQQKKEGVVFTTTDEDKLLFHRMFEESDTINLDSLMRKFERAPPYPLMNKVEVEKAVEQKEKESAENKRFVFKKNKHSEMLPNGSIQITIDQGRVLYFLHRLC